MKTLIIPPEVFRNKEVPLHWQLLEHDVLQQEGLELEWQRMASRDVLMLRLTRLKGPTLVRGARITLLIADRRLEDLDIRFLGKNRGITYHAKLSRALVVLRAALGLQIIYHEGS